MPTIFTHAAVPLALGLGLGRKVIPGKLLVAGVVAGMLPDIDGLGYHLGIPFSNMIGHRGVTHSVTIAAAVAFFAWLVAPKLGARRWVAALFVFVAMGSHGLLDMLTTGGPGVMLFWPFTDERFFFPWQFIRVSPMSLGPLLSQRGVAVALSEITFVWLPCLVMMLGLMMIRRYGGQSYAARKGFE